MSLSDNVYIQNTGVGVKGIHGWVDTQLSNTSGQHSGGVQVSEGSGRGGISQVVCGHIDSLQHKVNNVNNLQHKVNSLCKKFSTPKELKF